MVEVEETLSQTEQQSTPALPLGRLGGDDELLPTTLIDRYQIERRLGAGAMGVVYAARDIHLRRAVAVKVVGPRIDTGSGQGRLVREAQAMAKLRHPNLAAVHDIGVSETASSW
jgi:serine/threonine protein kinase